MFRFAVLFVASLLAGGFAAQADNTMVKRLKALNACPGCDSTVADLAEVHLEYVNLKGANLAGADLIEANLTRADLTGADLTGVNLKDAYSITGAKLCNTVTPLGIDNSGCKKK